MAANKDEVAALRAEVVHKGIRVSTIIPGYIQTNISVAALKGDGTTFGKVDSAIAGGMDKLMAQYHEAGIETVTQRMMEVLDRRHLCRMIIINQIDQVDDYRGCPHLFPRSSNSYGLYLVPCIAYPGCVNKSEADTFDMDFIFNKIPSGPGYV